LTLEQIKTLDAGYSWTNDDGATYPFRGLGIHVPTLEEVFQALPHTRLVIEIKPSSPEVAASVCRSILKFGREEKVLAASFHQEAMDRFRQECPAVATAATVREALLFFQLTRFYLDFLVDPEAEALQVPEAFRDMDVLTPRFLSGARRFNIQVHVWTVNEIEDLKRIASRGVDGIVTDYPDRLLEMLGRKLH
jgi:glycerophosphoryl diester phosphodiesterase